VKNSKKRVSLDDLYEHINRLHAEIFSYYSKIQSQNMEHAETKELERFMRASRNIMNAMKNFKGIRLNMTEFDGSNNPFINTQ
jgi:phosphate:Na+ symporter